ncbi:hypothetical protein JYU34_003016 [Plutella xylostella]|uniref:Uncharacterized protein n=1 Tax=Plutella xylostella TaxID=51655 RepID=A0ABQ7QYY9_PLUXY|nr:hypothetical protein JYU34_003016 [Plutella xylostella]
MSMSRPRDWCRQHHGGAPRDAISLSSPPPPPPPPAAFRRELSPLQLLYPGGIEIKRSCGYGGAKPYYLPTGGYSRGSY